MNFKKTVMFSLAAAVLFLAVSNIALPAAEESATPEIKCPKKVPVVLETVKPGTFLEYRYFSAPARTEIVAVKSSVSGLISEIKVSEGSLVDANQELAILNAGMNQEVKKLELAAAKAKKILVARQNWKEKSEPAIQSAEKDYQNALALLNEKKAQVDQIVKAPLAGIIHLVAAAGTEIAADTLLMEISNPQRMIFMVPLTETDKGSLTIGEKFIGTSEGYNGEIEAEIVKVSATHAWLGVNNDANQVKDGVSFNFKKFVAEYADAITVPGTAIQSDSLGDFVYVAEKKKAKKLYVTLGAAANGRTMIAKGLAAETMLIVSGLECLVDGKPVRIVNQDELDKEKAKAEAKLKEIKAAKTEKKVTEPEVKAEKPEKEKKAAQTDKGLVRVGLTFERFTINDKNLRAFYDNWFQHIPGIEFSYQAFDKVDIWAAGKIYSDVQPTTYFENESKFRLIPLSLGLRFRPVKAGAFEPFVGAGVNFYLYSEKIEGETDLEPTSGSAFGFHFQGGTYIYFGPSFLNSVFAKHNRSLMGEIFIKYNMVNKTLAELLPDGTDKLDLGGFEMGVGLVVKF